MRYKQTFRAGASDSRDVLIQIGELSVLDNSAFAITERIDKSSERREIGAGVKIAIKI